jgi:hypothetical protein
MTHYSWDEFCKYASEFLCINCDKAKIRIREIASGIRIDGVKEPLRENDKCIDICMKMWINYMKQKEND